MIPNPPFHHSREHQAGPGIAGQERRLEKRERIMESLGIEPVYIGYQRQLMLTAKGVDILLANKSLFQDPRNAKARKSPPDFEGESFPSDFPKSKTAVDFR